MSRQPEKGHNRAQDRRFYDILGVSHHASQEDIREAYKSVAKKLHPDKQNTSGHHESQNFKELQRAYQVLANDSQRQIYDQLGEEGIELACTQALQKKNYTADELTHKLRKIHHRTKKDWFAENLAYKGQTVIAMHVDSLRDVLLGRRFISQEYNLFTQTIKFPFGPHLFLIDTTARNNTEYGAPTSIRLRYQYHLDHKTKLLSGVQFNHDCAHYETGYRATLDQYTSLKQTLFWDTRFPTPDLRIVVDRQLFLPYIAPFHCPEEARRTLIGTFGLFCGFFTRAQASVKYLSPTISGDFGTVVDLRSIQISGNTTFWNKTKDTKASFGASIHLPFDLSFSSDITYQLTQETECGFENIVSLLRGVQVAFKFSRWGQLFSFPITLSVVPTIQSWLAGMVFSVVGAFLLHFLLIKPKKQQKIALKQNKMNLEAEARKQQAQEFLKSRKFTIEKQFDTEQRRPGGGLIIRYAHYGNLSKMNNFTTEHANTWIEDISDEVSSDPEIIEVTHALQLEVVDPGALTLSTRPKHVAIPGVWDPCPGKDKYLEVFYLHLGAKHRVLIPDEAAVILPHADHQVKK